MLTGEAQPVDRGPGDSALASTMVLQRRLYIQIGHSGTDTLAAPVAKVLADTGMYKRELKGWRFATAVVLGQVSTPLALYSLVGPTAEYHTEEPGLIDSSAARPPCALQSTN